MHATVTAGRFDLVLTHAVDGGLQSLDGVGKKTAAKLRDRGIETLTDLLLHVPRKYRRVAHWVDGQEIADEQYANIEFSAPILSVRPPQRNTRQPLEVVVDHDGQRFKLLWFNRGSTRMSHAFRQGDWLYVAGEVKYDASLPTLMHPSFNVLGPNAPADVPDAYFTVEPVYATPEGISETQHRKMVLQAFERLHPYMADIVPKGVVHERSLPSVAEALSVI
ncbi:MAG: hypothetical protein AAGI01_18445, partial [Myxococcota bacterium]